MIGMSSAYRCCDSGTTNMKWCSPWQCRSCSSASSRSFSVAVSARRCGKCELPLSTTIKTLESRAIIQAACRHQEIHPTNGLWRTDADWPIEKLSKLLISQKAAEVVVHIPAGFTTQDPQAPNLSIQLYNEGTNPIAHAWSKPDWLNRSRCNSPKPTWKRPLHSARRTTCLRHSSGPPPIHFNSNIVILLIPSDGSAHQRNDQRTEQRSPSVATSRGEEQQVFRSIDVFATNKHQPKIALYAAGIAVMFLLFSASGTGASLLEEREAGTLGRLMTSRLSVTELVSASGSSQLPWVASNWSSCLSGAK